MVDTPATLTETIERFRVNARARPVAVTSLTQEDRHLVAIGFRDE
jgi:hypothetical protein